MISFSRWESKISRTRSALTASRDKTISPHDQHQIFLLPPSFGDRLVTQPTTRFISETVESVLDLSLVYNAD